MPCPHFFSLGHREVEILETDRKRGRKNRRSLRLEHYDYMQPGAYFVTVCTKGRRCLLGEVMNGEMRLSESGRVVAESWAWLANQYPYVELDAFIVMPNHIHGIIVMREESDRGRSRTAPTKRKSLGRLIGAVKTVSTKRINQLRGTPGVSIWQRNYYEHVIRSDKSMDIIREYILGNPGGWAYDRENPITPRRRISLSQGEPWRV